MQVRVIGSVVLGVVLSGNTLAQTNTPAVTATNPPASLAELPF